MNCALLDGAMKYKAGITKNFCVKKMKFSIKGFLSKFNQIIRKMYILSHLLKNLIENFIFLCTGLKNISLLMYFQCWWSQNYVILQNFNQVFKQGSFRPYYIINKRSGIFKETYLSFYFIVLIEETKQPVIDT